MLRQEELVKVIDLWVHFCSDEDAGDYGNRLKRGFEEGRGGGDGGREDSLEEKPC